MAKSYASFLQRFIANYSQNCIKKHNGNLIIISLFSIRARELITCSTRLETEAAAIVEPVAVAE